MSIKGIPIYICNNKLLWSEQDIEPNGLALTHAELKELMREAFEAARETNNALYVIYESEIKYPDFETYYQGKQK